MVELFFPYTFLRAGETEQILADKPHECQVGNSLTRLHFL